MLEIVRAIYYAKLMHSFRFVSFSRYIINLFSDKTSLYHHQFSNNPIRDKNAFLG